LNSSWFSAAFCCAPTARQGTVHCCISAEHGLAARQLRFKCHSGKSAANAQLNFCWNPFC
jgi:hypothetical protein